MYLQLPSRRRTANALAALLLTFAFLHCAWEWRAELHHRSAARAYRAAGEPLPIGFPTPGCDHDTGCICKGATVAQGVDTAGLAAGNAVSVWLELETALQPGDALDLSPRELLPLVECHAPPLSGRQLRALYASLVI